MRHYEAQLIPIDMGVVAVEASASSLLRVTAVLGADLPTGAQCVGTPHGILHRSGPESVTVLTPVRDADALAGRLAAAGGEASAIVADMSEGHAWMQVAGSDALDVLSQGVAIDLRETALPPGQATRTLCFGVEVILLRDRPDTFSVGCRASHGAFLAARLRLACDPLGEGSRWA